MGLEAALYTHLKNNAGVAALVSDRIFPQLMKEGTTLPAITFQFISGFRQLVLQGKSGYARPRIQVDCWALSEDPAGGYDKAKAVANAVRLALDGFAGVVSGVSIRSATLLNEQDFDADEGRIRRVSLDFSIHYLEAVA